ncbi:DUF6215 domain-containing protein [Kitasatospora sp. NPDC057198]|uniref:DUF6215 domain-containing protein n=1 Tax=Kitasatospora sp. NPDC057198 TaxID=3346046 RepID=UPI0036454DCA
MGEYLAGVGRNIAIRGAVGLVVLTGGLIWHSGQDSGGRRAGDDGPAVCGPTQPDWPAGYPAMCAALNRPDLAELMEVPGERTVSAGVGTYSPQISAAARVQVGMVTVSAIEYPALPYDLEVDDPRVSAVEAGPVSGRPAISYTDATLWVSLGSGSGSGSGGAAPRKGWTHHLVVARNADGSGGCIELAAWRNDGGEVNSDTLPRLAEKMLPTLALDGWQTPPLPAEPGQPPRSPRPSPSPTDFRPFSG